MADPRVVAAVLAHPWREGAWGAHADHGYDGACKVCRGDVAAILDVAERAAADLSGEPWGVYDHTEHRLYGVHPATRSNAETEAVGTAEHDPGHRYEAVPTREGERLANEYAAGRFAGLRETPATPGG